VITADKVQ